MTSNELTLLKRCRYDKSEWRDSNEEEFTWSASQDVYALDVYKYKGKTYAVESSLSYSGKGDIVDSDHYESLTFTVYPIETDAAESEEAVLALTSGKDGHKTRIGDRPQVDISSEEAFTKSVRHHVIAAIDAYVADLRRAEASCGKVMPNAVYVDHGKARKPTVIYDFSSHAGIGTVFYNCTSVAVKPLDEESQKALGVIRPLCYCYPADRGAVGVYAYCDENMKYRDIIVSMKSKFQSGDGAVICAYVKDKPAPLTFEEVRTILDFPTL